MILLHATWIPPRETNRRPGLFLWAEQLADDLVPEDAPHLSGRVLPRLLPPRALRSLLRHVGDGLLYECAESEALEYLWPTRKGVPLPSPAAGEPAAMRRTGPGPAVVPGGGGRPATASGTGEKPTTKSGTGEEPAKEQGTPSLDGWVIQGLRVPPEDTLRFLAEISEGEDPSLRWGPTLRYWRNAGAYCLDLIARGRFVPTLVEQSREGQRTLRALWKPALSREGDRRVLDALVDALPGMCRAWRDVSPDYLEIDGLDDEALEDEPEPPPGFLSEPETPAPSPRPLVRSFLDLATDSLIRRWLAEAGFPDRGRRHRARTHALAGPVGAWLRSLAWIDDRLEIDSQTMEEFASGIRRWNQMVVDPDAGAYRLAFRLVSPAGETGVAAVEPSAPAASTPDGVAPDRIPADGDGGWRLELHLQACDDPAMLAPAAQLWRDPSPSFHWGRRSFPHAQERFLSDLASAAKVFPPVLRALDGPLPQQCPLTVEEAYSFLVQEGRRLDAAGFGILDPSWWTEGAIRPQLRLFLRPRQGGGHEDFGPQALLDYNWEVALGPTTLTAAEFHELARRNLPLVRIAGRWVELRPEDTRVLDRVLRDQARKPTLSLSEALRLGLGGQANQGAIPPPEVHADGWIGDLLDQARGLRSPRVIRHLVGFSGSLRPYQGRGLGWLSYLEGYGFGACLADDMGLGKTVQLIALLVHEREELQRRLELRRQAAGAVAADAAHAATGATTPGTGATAPGTDETTTRMGEATPGTDETTTAPTGMTRATASTGMDGAGGETAQEAERIGPTLVLCPMSVVGNWQREIQRFAPSLRVLLHHGLNRLRSTSFLNEAAAHDVIISTYALARRDHEHFRRIPWHRVVLDEAQNVKNPSTQQSRAVRSLQARFRTALTGTPLENRLSELWSIFDFLNPGYLGTLSEFRKRFARPIERDGDLDRRTLLHNLTRPFLLRRLKTDPEVIRDLPEKLEMRVFTNLTQEQATLYQAVVDEMLGRIDGSQGIARRGLILSTITRLKQICNHPTHYLQDGSKLEGRSGKVERLGEMLEEVLSVGDRALCFTQFTEMGLMLRSYLVKRLHTRVLFLHGGTPQGERDRMVEEFQNGEDHPIFILSVRAGGTGLNLTAANHVFHFDRWWNPAVENQATDRAFRIGQTRNVQVHKFVCVGTLEERIDRIIEEKRNLADLVLGAGEQWLTELSTDQLREVLTLSRDAVSEF